jgi:hypothetical protein
MFVVTVGQLNMQRYFILLQFFEELQYGVALNFFDIGHDNSNL